MKIVPVIDILGNQVVHAVGGNRQNYQPLISILTRSTKPVQVIRDLLQKFSFDELYIAHLDPIMNRPGIFDIGTIANQLGSSSLTTIWLDQGIRNRCDLANFPLSPLFHMVLGLETIRSRKNLSELCNDLLNSGKLENVLFSLDLRAGEPLADSEDWLSSLAPRNYSSTYLSETIIAHAIQCGIQKILLLDLAYVGGGQGTGTESLTRILRERYPEIKIYVGGGIHSPQELAEWEALGIDGVLIASALHNGNIPLS